MLSFVPVNGTVWMMWSPTSHTIDGKHCHEHQSNVFHCCVSCLTCELTRLHTTHQNNHVHTCSLVPFARWSAACFMYALVNVLCTMCNVRTYEPNNCTENKCYDLFREIWSYSVVCHSRRTHTQPTAHCSRCDAIKPSKLRPKCIFICYARMHIVASEEPIMAYRMCCVECTPNRRTGETRVAAKQQKQNLLTAGWVPACIVVVVAAIIINNYCIHFVSFDIKLQFNSSLRVRSTFDVCVSV